MISRPEKVRNINKNFKSHGNIYKFLNQKTIFINDFNSHLNLSVSVKTEEH